MHRTRAEELAGRPVEVEQTRDGKFVVLWMNFVESPPPKGDTEEEALEKFVAYMEARTLKDENGFVVENGVESPSEAT